MSDSIIPSEYSRTYLISDEWKRVNKGIPVPQGNIPMINSLKKYKQESLFNAYNKVLKN